MQYNSVKFDARKGAQKGPKYVLLTSRFFTTILNFTRTSILGKIEPALKEKKV